MMKRTLPYLLVIAGLAGGCLSGDPKGGEDCAIRSPNGQHEIRLAFNPLRYEVRHAGQTLIAPTEIAMTIDGRTLATGIPTLTTRRRTGNVPAPVYKKANVDLAANELFADFGAWGLRLIARDDGVAYRFETKMPGQITVNSETADVTLNQDVTAFVNYCARGFNGDALQCSYETVNQTRTGSDLAKTNTPIYLPLVYQTKAGTAICVTEADLIDYPGWYLKGTTAATTENGLHLRGTFAAYPKTTRYYDWAAPKETTRRLRSQKVLTREDYLVKTTGTRTFPWRCFLIGQDASQLVASDLVWALAAPTKEFDFTWVKPGKVAWDWWNDFDNLGTEKGCTTKGYERFIDFAAKNGVEYVIFDEGWSEHLNIWKCHPRVDVPHLIAYANARGVGIILWMAWAQVVGDEARVARHFAQMGAKGFKVDFMDRDDAACVNFIWKFAEACAREKMLIDYHGMFKPTGLERTYPNVLNFEGIHGLEQMKWHSFTYDMMASDVKSYFVRMSAGPMDYTPGAMDNYPIGNRALFKGTNQNPGSLGTRCRQMAMMALYYAPLQMLCDAPTKYEKNMECFAFMAATPVTWDDTVGLAGDPESHCTCARRKGDVWYAAGMTNAQSRDYTLDTSFLGAGTWKVEIFRDAADADVAPTHYVHEQVPALKAGEKRTIHLARGGGFIMRFTK